MYYDGILSKLSPFMDKVFFLPMTWEDLTILEAQADLQFPDYYKYYLLTFGLRQDLLYELFQREIDYTEQYNYLPKEIKEEFIPIGGSPASGDTWLISLLNSNDQRIYSYFYDDDLTLLDFTFHELIEKGVSDFIDQYDNKAFNHSKKWRVQFSIKTENESLIYNSIGAIRSKEWIHTEISPAMVYCFESEIEYDSKKIRLARQEHKDWDTPIFYFNFEEDIDRIRDDSSIKRIDGVLKKHFAGYALIDYGVLSL